MIASCDTIHCTFEIQEEGHTLPSVALSELLTVSFEIPGGWKVTNPEGHTSWVGCSSYRKLAILNYPRCRLGIKPDEE